jgi:4-amino-4-deoxychorismate lyase
MTARVLVNGEAADQVSVMDRGLTYGDGLFESIRFVGTRAPLWHRHMQRLGESCQRLRLPVPDPAQWHAEALQVSHGMAQAVVRLVVTRGEGARGYAMPSVACPTRIVSAFVPPVVGLDAYAQGVHMRVCELRLAEQPLLAGMKHLNRLEQVLARAEWDDPAIAEGLLRDTAGRVVSAVMANLFAVVDNQLVTPSLDRCGVAGVARAEVLAAMPETRIGELTLDQLLAAHEIFLSSSVRGILPVRSLNGRRFAAGIMTRQMQRHWHNLGFTSEQHG